MIGWTHVTRAQFFQSRLSHSLRKKPSLHTVFLLNCKICLASTTWKELIQKSLCLPIFRNITEMVKKIKSLYGFGGRCHKITEVCMQLDLCSTLEQQTCSKNQSH